MYLLLCFTDLLKDGMAVYRAQWTDWGDSGGEFDQNCPAIIWRPAGHQRWKKRLQAKQRVYILRLGKEMAELASTKYHNHLRLQEKAQGLFQAEVTAMKNLSLF